MRRKLLIGLLAAGTVGGFAAGCAKMSHHRHHHKRAAFENRVAEVCVAAAQRVMARAPAPGTGNR